MYAFPSQTQAGQQAAHTSSIPNAVPSPSQSPHTNNSQATASSGRKMACRNCRQRKKKCDAQLPVCSGCMKSNARCTYLPTSVGSITDQFYQPHTSWALPNNDLAFPFAGPTSTLPPVSAQIVEGHHLNVPQPLAWDFNVASTIFTPNFPPNRPNPQSSSAPNALERNSASSEGASSTVQAHSRSEDKRSPGDSSNGGSDPIVSTAETSITLLPDQNEDIEIRNFHTHRPHGGHLSRTLDTLGLQLQMDHLSGGKDIPPRRGLPPMNSIDSAKTESSNAYLDELLPSVPVILELVHTFFSRCHQMLPCIHHQSFLKRLRHGGRSIASDPLVWTVLAVVAPNYQVQQIQDQQQAWLARARLLVDKNASQSLSPTHLLQAAVWLAFQAWVLADLTEAWFLVGKSCRIANVLRLDQIDSSRPKQVISMAPRPRNAIEVEEQRKVMWSLLYLERSLACLGGFTLGVDERFFQVNYPIDDMVFQNLNSLDQPSHATSEAFNMDLNSLLNLSVMQKLGLHPTLDHIFRASVLLGRIMNLHNDLHTSRNDERFKKDFTQLETGTALFEFTLSRFATDQQDSETDARDLWLFYWLHALVQTCTILLYHPLASSPISSTSTQYGASQSQGKNDPNFQRCLRAARQFHSVAKRAIGQSIDVLANPFLATALFLCGRFIAIAWHDEQEDSDRDDIDFILLLMDRIGEVWEPLAKKFRKAILRDLIMNREDAKLMMVGTGCYSSVECA